MRAPRATPRRSRSKPAPGSRFLDRDLNWLEFNRRVLNEALDERTPLLERVNFLAIFTSNLDEFVMKRVYGLREQIWAGVKGSDATREQTSEGLLHAIHAAIQEMLNRQADGYHRAIKPALAAQGSHLLGWNNLTDRGSYFRQDRLSGPDPSLRGYGPSVSFHVQPLVVPRDDLE